jgi:hypothetical protein
MPRTFLLWGSIATAPISFTHFVRLAKARGSKRPKLQQQERDYCKR